MGNFLNIFSTGRIDCDPKDAMWCHGDRCNWQGQACLADTPGNETGKTRCCEDGYWVTSSLCEKK